MSAFAAIVCILAALVSFVLGWLLSKQISHKLQVRLEDKLRQQAEKIDNLSLHLFRPSSTIRNSLTRLLKNGLLL